MNANSFHFPKANESSTTQAEEEPDYIWTELSINASILAPLELQEYIERSINEDLIEPLFFAQDDYYTIKLHSSLFLFQEALNNLDGYCDIHPNNKLQIVRSA